MRHKNKKDKTICTYHKPNVLSQKSSRKPKTVCCTSFESAAGQLMLYFLEKANIFLTTNLLKRIKSKLKLFSGKVYGYNNSFIFHNCPTQISTNLAIKQLSGPYSGNTTI